MIIKQFDCFLPINNYLPSVLYYCWGEDAILELLSRGMANSE